VLSWLRWCDKKVLTWGGSALSGVHLLPWFQWQSPALRLGTPRLRPCVAEGLRCTASAASCSMASQIEHRPFAWGVTCILVARLLSCLTTKWWRCKAVVYGWVQKAMLRGLVLIVSDGAYTCCRMCGSVGRQEVGTT
jgi:hypothetical protein